MDDKAKDCVCGMEVEKSEDRKETYEGREYYFCSDDCQEKFNEDPADAVSRADDPPR